MIESSIVPPLGILIIPYTRDLTELLLALGLVFVGFVLYGKVSVFNIVIGSRLLDSMTKEPLVSNKIRLAKSFVVLSFGHLLVAVSGCVLLMVYDVTSIALTVFFESLFLLGTCLQMLFFMFRKQYAGERTGRDVEANESRGKSRMVTVCEPNRRRLALAVDL
jgi:hypothetical protein